MSSLTLQQDLTGRSLVASEVALTLVYRHAAGEITCLGGEVAHGAQGINAAEKELDSTVCGTWCVSRQFVASELDLVEGKAALLSP